MAINANTLNNLYNQGILDYVPYDLIGNGGLSTLTPAQNPYLNTAMQGQLYQTHGYGNDSFTKSPNYTQNVEIGNSSNAGVNGFGLNGIGSQSNAGLNGFGIGGIGTTSASGLGFQSEQGVGVQSNAGVNGFGIGGVGTEAQGGMNAFGGVGDIKSGFNKVLGAIQNTPSIVKGIIAGTIAIGTLAFCLKKCGSKLNPVNWFKRNK